MASVRKVVCISYDTGKTIKRGGNESSVDI